MPNLNRFSYFAAVVEAGSFTQAAVRLGITKTVVSEQVRLLEAEMRASLLVRSTRKVVPTEAGLQFYQHCAQILKIAEEATAELTEANSEPSGTLRIAAPNDYGTVHVAPVAAAFARRFQAVRIELLLSDARSDLIADLIDISVRVGWLADSSQQATRIGSFEQVLVGTPDLLQDHPIHRPEDLDRAPFIANTSLRQPTVFTLSNAAQPAKRVRLDARLTANSTPAVLSATLAGGGLAVLPDFVVLGHLRTGALIKVLPEWKLPSGGIHLVYPSARHRPAKVRRFAEALSRSIRDTGAEASSPIGLPPLEMGP